MTNTTPHEINGRPRHSVVFCKTGAKIRVVLTSHQTRTCPDLPVTFNNHRTSAFGVTVVTIDIVANNDYLLLLDTKKHNLQTYRKRDHAIKQCLYKCFIPCFHCQM